MSHRSGWTPLALAALLASGCASVGPRFSPEVAASFARDEMRRMETRSLVVYYPAHAREVVTPTLERLEHCAEKLRSATTSETERGKLVVLITSAEFNNAFVRARILGSPTEMVLPVQLGSELFNFFDFGITNVGDIACHEAVHYVQLEQTDGFWRYANLVFGDVASPNVSTETWFLEGLATYLEGNLGRHGGRPHSPLWTGMFAAGIASQGGEIDPGDLSPANRELYPFGGNYLAGSHFVGWLAKTYGEEKLWQLVDKQGRSIFFPVGVTLRFRSVFGSTIGDLLEAYSAELKQQHVARERPDSQRVLVPDLGYYARIASDRAGAIAMLHVGLDRETLLEVREPDGRLRFSQKMARVRFDRPWIVSSPAAASGLSFTADGRSLFLFSEELAADTEVVYEVRQFDALTGAHVRSWPGVRGLGGHVSPDGTRYLFIAVENDVAELAELDLASGAITRLTSYRAQDPLGAPAYSPDGRRIVFSRRDVNGFDLYLREADGTERRLTHDGRFNYGARFADDDSVVFIREEEGRAQVFRLSVSTGALTAVTRAPYAVMDPMPIDGGRVAFLNREAWVWTLDSERLPAPDAVTASSASAAPAPDSTPHAAPLSTEAADPEATAARLSVLSDEPYSGLDELFIPRLRIPFVGAGIDDLDRLQPYALLSLQGFDRLGWHSWAVNLTYFGANEQPSASLQYGTSLAAPWFLYAVASRAVERVTLFRSEDDAPPTPENAVGFRRITDLDLRVGASRPIWASEIALGFEALWRTSETQLDVPEPTRTQRQVRLIGPSASFSWFAGSGTAYAGTRRGLSTDFAATAYARGLGSDVNLADLRGAIGTWWPLPLSDRHTFAVSFRARTIAGPADGLLQVGGVSSGLLLRDTHFETPRRPNVYLPSISFVEPLRGFDDVGFRANSVGILSARYRYPFIVDRGVTSVLWLAPSFFLRQFEAEAFFEGARTDETTRPFHAAVGGLVRTRTLWASSFPITLFYQAAYRLDPGLGFQHTVGLAVE